MTSRSYSNPGFQRLNPFIFPSETDYRFMLLIVSVIGVSLMFFQILYNAIPGVYEKYLNIESQCIKEATQAYPDDLFARNDTATRCMMPSDRIRALTIIGAELLLFAVAGSIYWAMPLWKIRRARLVPINDQDAPGVLTFLDNLCHEIGLSSQPNYLWNPLNLSRTGLVFGHWGQYYLSISGGLLMQYYKDQRAFRSVLLHELSHLYNRDVDKTYFSISLWWAFVAVALVPYAISRPYALGQLDSTLDNLFNTGWRLIALTLLIYLVRNAILRARETYADVRASIWDGAGGKLRHAIKSLKGGSGSQWRKLWSVHPDPDQRLLALDDTGQLFNMGFWEAFGTGISTMITFSGFNFLFYLIVEKSQAWYWALTFASALIFAPLIVGVVGSGVWRNTFDALIRGKSPSGLNRLGIGIGLGAVLGQVLNIFSYYQRSYTGLNVTTFSLNFMWSLLLFVSLFLFIKWVALGASAWMKSAIHSHAPLTILRVGSVLSSFVLTLLLAFIFFSNPSGYSENVVHYIYEALDLDVMNALSPAIFISMVYFLVLVKNPLTFVGVVILCIYPLASWLWRNRIKTTVDATWVFLEKPAQPVEIPSGTPLQPVRAFVIGFFLGCIFCLLSFILCIGLCYLYKLFYNTSTLDMSTDPFLNFAMYGNILIAILVQIGVTIVVVVRVKQFGALHGIFASLVAGVLMAVGIMLLNIVVFGILEESPTRNYTQWYPFQNIRTIMELTVNLGALLAIPAALVSSSVAKWIRRPN